MNAVAKINLYELLGVPRDASREAINDAFKAKARTTHPDKGGDIDNFKQLKEARDCLCSRTSRAWYDETGEVRDEGPIKEQAALEMTILAIEEGYRESLKSPQIYYDIIYHAETHLLDKLKKVDDGINQIKFIIRSKQKLAKKLARKDKKKSLLASLILKQADDFGDKLELAERDRSILERALEALGEHDLT